MKGARSCVSCLRTNSLTLATIVGVVTGFVIGVRHITESIHCILQIKFLHQRLREYRVAAGGGQPRESRSLSEINHKFDLHYLIVLCSGVLAHEGRAVVGPRGDVRGVHRQALPSDAQVHHHSTHHPVPNLGRRVSR